MMAIHTTTRINPPTVPITMKKMEFVVVFLDSSSSLSVVIATQGSMLQLHFLEPVILNTSVFESKVTSVNGTVMLTLSVLLHGKDIEKPIGRRSENIHVHVFTPSGEILCAQCWKGTC